MNTSNITNYKPKDFAELLGVSVKTLQRWDREGTLKANRTPTDRRYYTYDQYPRRLLFNALSAVFKLFTPMPAAFRNIWTSSGFNRIAFSVSRLISKFSLSPGFKSCANGIHSSDPIFSPMFQTKNPSGIFLTI